VMRFSPRAGGGSRGEGSILGKVGDLFGDR
jgi:hypothetical protein